MDEYHEHLRAEARPQPSTSQDAYHRFLWETGAPPPPLPGTRERFWFQHGPKTQHEPPPSRKKRFSAKLKKLLQKMGLEK
ncbi:uncharacterized protein BKA78DRAFT_147276 [Phyllosticta capitalensis]|uniref:uncharacterized protein n=1 Tax=Phyllosticta capitalensis TaxID=121624 RepID=UPI00312FD937